MREGFTVITGGGDVVSFLEGMLERARDGDIEAIAVATLSPDGSAGRGLSFKPDTFSPWSRMIGAVAVLQDALVTGDLSFAP